jgi:ATP-dependent Clp protease protease subunit
MMKTKEEMVAILAKHTGQPLEKLYEVTKTDTFFSADEAVAFGLADKVVDFAEMVK